MKQKRLYVIPTIKVVELVSGSALLDTSVILKGYKYDSDGWED